MSNPTAMPKARPPLERMMKIHQALQSGSCPNANVLAAELEVTTKTVHRDIDFMRNRLDLPLEYSRQRKGFHYTEAVDSFPTLQITEGELFALLVAEKALQQYRGTNFEKPLVSAFKKMAASLPDTVSFHLADWDLAISFVTRAEPVLNLEIFDALAKATAKHQQVALTYRKPGSRKTEERIIDPVHLANINGEWFLFAFDHLRKAIRTFVPARVQAVRATGRTFARPAKFSLAKHLRDSFGVHSGEGDYEVVLRFTGFAADLIREKRWHSSQQLREMKDGVELRLRLSSLAEVQRWILGWAGNVKVIAPRELAEAVKKSAQQILAGYA
ncbi:MAG TPA: WYL domain-containing protein [Verrucomicrobiae bacterium]